MTFFSFLFHGVMVTKLWVNRCPCSTLKLVKVRLRSQNSFRFVYSSLCFAYNDTVLSVLIGVYSSSISSHPINILVKYMQNADNIQTQVKKAYLTLLFFLWQDREISRCSNSGSCLQRGWQQSLQTGGHPNWIPSYRLVFPPNTEIELWQMLKMSWGRYSTRLSMTCLCKISEMNYTSGKHRAFECAQSCSMFDLSRHVHSMFTTAEPRRHKMCWQTMPSQTKYNGRNIISLSYRFLQFNFTVSTLLRSLSLIYTYYI